MTQLAQTRRSNGSTVLEPWPEPTNHELLLINVRLPDRTGLQQVRVSQAGVIESVEAMGEVCDRARSPDLASDPESDPESDLEIIDLQADWLSLGGIDLQINGALGLAFPDLTPANAHLLPQICEFLWQQGVDAFLPTLVTCSLEQVHSALQVLQAYVTHDGEPAPPKHNAARILGVHLEGPCLNPEKRGAHPQEHLQPLTVAALEEVLGDHGNLVKLVTLAPELDPSGAAIDFLRRRGISVSLGHSLATAAEANLAFDRGATLVTHAFNAMPALHHREPGLLGAALGRRGVRCGVIADGQHITPLMLKLLLRMGPEHLFLVSDALAPLGLPDGCYPWDSREICVTQGTARLADGTLSGTTLPLLAGVRNLVRWGLASVEAAIALATTAPRQALSSEESAAPDSTHSNNASNNASNNTYVGQSMDSLLRWRLDPQTQALSWCRLYGPIAHSY